MAEIAYPCLREAALFYLDVLVEDGTGHLSFVPSTSPENKFLYQGTTLGVCRTATMTTAIIRETFSQTISSAERLNVDLELRTQLKQVMDRLPPYEIGSKGQLLEWNEEFTEHDPTHRHVSHLFGLYPAKQISFERTQALADACRRTLEIRSDDGTGWSISWKLCLWARLRDGDHAIQLLHQQLRLTRSERQNANHMGGGSYPNLFDAHPPFQIDGNFGVCAGISEMLLQSTGTEIELLPALPSDWKDGSFSNLRTETGIAVSAVWQDYVLMRAELSAPRACRIALRYGTHQAKYDLNAGKTLILTKF